MAGDDGDSTLSRSERKRRFQAAQASSTNSHSTNVVAGMKKLKKSAFLSLHEDATPAYARRCIVEYDGTRFNGFQAQAQHDTMRTVQEILEDAILRTTGETVRVKGCSRTDKGVHALGQVIVFASKCNVDDRGFRDALNTRLPDDVVCRSLTTLQSIDDEAFDPRVNAIGKIYEYVIVTGPVRPVFDRDRVWFIKKSLNTQQMQAAIAYFTAPPIAKDYSAFTPPKSSQQNSDSNKGNVCALHCIELIEEPLRTEDIDDVDDDQRDSGFRIRLRFHGDRFLYKMVRNLVGTLMDVGLGRILPTVIPTILETKDRSKAGQGAPPQGLTLVRVLYREPMGSNKA